MDKLFITGLELWMRVGCTAGERAFPQRLLLDVDMEAPLGAAGRKDDMRRTVDYADVIKRIKQAVEPRRFKLIEAVAEEAAGLVLRRYKVRRVTVRVRKKALPGIDHAGVEITRPER